MDTRVFVRPLLVSLLGIALALGSAAPAHADTKGFISPLIGYNFGGDATCPAITGCEDKRLNAGVSLGVMGNIFGFEEEFAYAKDFFGSALGLNSSVLTAMTNVMVVPNIGPIRPYGVAGVGLIKTHVELTPTSIFTSDNNSFGWDLGGGLIIQFAPHVGVRGDLRYFHAFQDLSILGFTLKDTKLDFARAAGALMLMW